jgi:hypothetical protein
VIRFDVRGIPSPKGSARAMLRGGHAVNVPSGSNANRARLEDWRSAIASAAIAATEKPGATATELIETARVVRFPDGAVAIGVLYRFPMRAGDLGKHGPKESAPFYLPTGKDTDKLQRATFDAITTSGAIWRDDAQVSLELGVRIYVPPGAWTGATVVVSPADGHASDVVGAIATLVDLAIDQMAKAKAAAVQLGRAPRPRTGRKGRGVDAVLGDPAPALGLDMRPPDVVTGARPGAEDFG